MKLIKLTDCQKEDIYNIFSITDELIDGKYTDPLKGKCFFRIQASGRELLLKKVYIY